MSKIVYNRQWMFPKIILKPPYNNDQILHKRKSFITFSSNSNAFYVIHFSLIIGVNQKPTFNFCDIKWMKFIEKKYCHVPPAVWFCLDILLILQSLGVYGPARKTLTSILFVLFVFYQITEDPELYFENILGMLNQIMASNLRQVKDKDFQLR